MSNFPSGMFDACDPYGQREFDAWLEKHELPDEEAIDDSAARQDWLRSVYAACDAEDAADTDPPSAADYVRRYQGVAAPLLVTDEPVDGDGGVFAVWDGDAAAGDDEFDYMMHE